MNKQTVKELKSLAKKHGIKGYYLMNKAELIKNLANEIHLRGNEAIRATRSLVIYHFITNAVSWNNC